MAERGDVAWSISAPDGAQVGDPIEISVEGTCENGERRDTDFGITNPRCQWNSVQVRFRQPDGAGPTSDAFGTGLLDEGETATFTVPFTPAMSGAHTFEVVWWEGPAVGGGYAVEAQTTTTVGEADASSLHVRGIDFTKQPGGPGVVDAVVTVTVENVIEQGAGATLERNIQVTQNGQALTDFPVVTAQPGETTTVDAVAESLDPGDHEFCATVG